MKKKEKVFWWLLFFLFLVFTSGYIIGVHTTEYEGDIDLLYIGYNKGWSDCRWNETLYGGLNKDGNV